MVGESSHKSRRRVPREVVLWVNKPRGSCVVLAATLYPLWFLSRIAQAGCPCRIAIVNKLLHEIFLYVSWNVGI